MLYFVILLILLFIANMNGGSAIVRTRRNSKDSSLFFCVALLSFMGLRNMSVGTDTATYVYDIMGKSKLVWQNPLALFKSLAEPLYTVVAYILSCITKNYTVYLIAFALPIAFSFGFYIKKYSKDYMLSALIFMVLGVMGFCMSALRQSVSLAICLFGYRFVREKKLIPFLLCILIAYGFHNSSIVFLILYPLSLIKRIDYRWWLGVIIAFILGATKNSVVLRMASFFITEDRFEKYYTSICKTSLNYTMLIIQGALVLFCFMHRRTILAEDETDSILYVMSFLGMVFQSFTPIMGEFFRLSMYFSVALCILVPKTIYYMRVSSSRLTAYIGVSAISVAYMLLATTSIVNSYHPFWVGG